MSSFTNPDCTHPQNSCTQLSSKMALQWMRTIPASIQKLSLSKIICQVNREPPWTWPNTPLSWRDSLQLLRSMQRLSRLRQVYFCDLDSQFQPFNSNIFCLTLKGRPMKCLLAFSAYTNGLKLVNMKPSSEHELGCIHGIRLLSMSWVLLGHSFGFPLQVARKLIN